MKTNTRGFSLVELMIVIAIIAVLAVIAVPSYVNYVNKAHLSEVFSTLKQDEENIITYVATNNMPANIADATNMLTAIGGLTVCNSIYVSTAPGSCTFGQYGIHITTNIAQLPAITIDITPTLVGNLYRWNCSYEAATTVSSGIEILPVNCNQLNTAVSALW